MRISTTIPGQPEDYAEWYMKDQVKLLPKRDRGMLFMVESGRTWAEIAALHGGTAAEVKAQVKQLKHDLVQALRDRMAVIYPRWNMKGHMEKSKSDRLEMAAVGKRAFS